MYSIKQTVRVKDYELCVMAVEVLHVPAFRMKLDITNVQIPGLTEADSAAAVAAASAGGPQRVLFVDLLYRNPTAGKAIDCRRNQWFVYDTDGYSYEAVESNRFLYENNGKPFLGGTRFINPGMKARGWLAYELREGAVPERIQFVDGFLSGNTADFRLEV